MLQPELREYIRNQSDCKIRYRALSKKMYIYLYIKRTTAIFDFDHIDKSIDENQLDEIKALYRFYHKKFGRFGDNSNISND